MPKDIAPILDELREDHRNMARLLDLLEQQSEALLDEDSSDLELMLDIMHYMTVYSDAVHHPKEDRLYAELRAARPDLSQGMGRVCDEHHTLSLQSVMLRDRLVEAFSGNAVRRKDIVADALRYIGTLRAHMHWEESDLFRRLDVMVADGHGQIESSTLVEHRDPLFGATLEARFKSLFDAING